MRFISKRLSKRILSEKNLPLNLLESYALVFNLGRYSLVSRSVENLDIKDFNIASIGLPLDKISA